MLSGGAAVAVAFWLSMAFIGYAYFGYPLVLAALTALSRDT